MVRCHIAKLERIRWGSEDADSLQLKCLGTSGRRNATMLIVPCDGSAPSSRASGLWKSVAIVSQGKKRKVAVYSCGVKKKKTTPNRR